MFGCMRSNGRLQLLSSWFSCDCSIGDDPTPDAELRAGRFVELTEFASCGPVPDPSCGGSTTIAARPPEQARPLRRRATSPQVVARGRFFAYADGRVVLVHGRDERVLDPGPGIEDGSLAFSRTRLYWIRDGQPHSALLQ